MCPLHRLKTVLPFFGGEKNYILNKCYKFYTKILIVKVPVIYWKWKLENFLIELLKLYLINRNV